MIVYYLTYENTFSKAQLDEVKKYATIKFLDRNLDVSIKQMQNQIDKKIIVFDESFCGNKIPNSFYTIKGIKAVCVNGFKNVFNREKCFENGINVITIPKYATNSVAEYLIMLMLCLAKKLPLQLKNNNKQVFTKTYEQTLLEGKNVGIVGMGQIGKRVAKICYAMGMKVFYCSNTNQTFINYRPVEIENIFAQCDVIFITLRSSDAKSIVINDKYLYLLKPNAIIISGTGRGVFNTKTIKELVNSGKIYGFAQEEPNKDLFSISGNVMVTSEYAWFTAEEILKRKQFCHNNIINTLKKYIFI